MTTRPFPYRSLFWPLILIGVGVIWLLSNLGVLSPASISVLFRLWPVILIVIGLDLLFGRQSPALGALLGLGAVVVIIALMLIGPSLGWASDVEVNSGSYSEPVGDAVSAQVNLSVGLGDLRVTALSDSPNLMEADIKYVGEVEFKTEGQTDKFVSLSQKDTNVSFGFGFFNFLFDPNQQLTWDVRLNTGVPMNLTINAGVGGANLDLGSVKLTALSVNTGTGGIDLRLPRMEESYNVTVSAGTGGGTLRIPDGSALVLDASAGTGGFTIDVPQDAAVRLEASTGTGSITVPANLRRVSGDDDSFVGESGTWETEGFASAERQIIIRYEGGTGGLTVQ